MTNNISNSLNLIKSFPKVFTHLIIGVSVSLVLLPTDKALADYPSVYTHAINLSLSYNQCKTKANNAAKLVLSEFQTPAEGDWGFQILGNTAATTAIFYCIKNPQSSTFIVVTSCKWYQYQEEAKSVRNRIIQIMLSNL